MTGAEFRAMLAQLGLRQLAFAETLGVHPVTVRHWARGARPIPRYVVAYLELAEEKMGSCKNTLDTM